MQPPRFGSLAGLLAVFLSFVLVTPAFAGSRSKAAARGRVDREALLRGESATVRSFRGDNGRLEYAEALLGRTLDAKERKLIKDAHAIGRGERGRHGGRAGIRRDGTTNYTEAHIVAKARKLAREGGFKMDEIRALMDHGVLGDKTGGASLLTSGLLVLGSSLLTAVVQHDSIYAYGAMGGLWLAGQGVSQLVADRYKPGVTTINTGLSIIAASLLTAVTQQNATFAYGALGGLYFVSSGIAQVASATNEPTERRSKRRR